MLPTTTPKDEMDDSSQISLREAADRLGVHYMTAYKYVRSGRLRAHKHGDEWLVRVSDVDDVTPGRQEAAKGVRGSPRRRESAAPRLEERLTVGDEPGAWAVVESAIHSGATPEDVYLDMLIPALESIGVRWAAGTIDIADEHQASAVAARLIGRMGPRFLRPGKSKGHVVVGTAAGDSHSLPSALLADILRGANYTVTDLGANTPPDSFVHAIASVAKLVAVGVCVTVGDATRGARAAARAIRDAGWEGAVFIGGRAIPTRQAAERLGASHWETNVQDLLRVLDGLRPQRP